MKPEKIAFRLNSDKAVEYANAHAENGWKYLDTGMFFHVPAYNIADFVKKVQASDNVQPGYTDVTENFERDYWGPWKDKLASVRQDSIVPCDAPVDSGNTGGQEDCDLVCPFCGEDLNFDRIGLKYHLRKYCHVYEETPNP